MNPFSILMFCFSGMLFLYAALLALTRDVKLIPRSHAVKMKDGRAYAGKVAAIIALVAVAPIHGGVIAMFNGTAAAVVMAAELVAILWVAAKLTGDD